MIPSTAVPAVTNGTVRSKKGEMHGFEQHVSLTLPPLSTMYFQVPAARKPRAQKEEAAPAKAPAKAKRQPLPSAPALPKPNRRPKRLLRDG